jgi:sulfide:quinone oxidoreductase
MSTERVAEPETEGRFRVVVAGGGVAALEACLALGALAGDRIRITLLAPGPDFVPRPMRVREPFGASLARHYPLDTIAGDLGLERRVDSFKWLDAPGAVVHTANGDALPYDALLIAIGARMCPAFSHALSIDDAHLDEQLHGLIQDIEAGYVGSVAFVAPAAMAWPLPMYELALMTARRAEEMQSELSITIVTPEDAPLAVFGASASERVAELLAASDILTVTSARCAVPTPGWVTIRPGARRLHVDRVIALPELFGPSTPGIPGGPARGFIPVDVHCQVHGLLRVFAAGDATDYPIKHGAIAAQQADTAAQAIAQLAGAPVHAQPFQPTLEGVLLGGDVPLYLSAIVSGSHGVHSLVDVDHTWPVSGKISALRLAPYLESLDRRGLGRPGPVRVPVGASAARG